MGVKAHMDLCFTLIPASSIVSPPSNTDLSHFHPHLIITMLVFNSHLNVLDYVFEVLASYCLVCGYQLVLT
jgi:hypothetical protein